MPERRRGPLLRTQLLAWLLAPLLLLLTVDTLVSYWLALDLSRHAHDRTLVGVAREAGLHLRDDGPGPRFDMSAEARGVLLTDPDDRLFLQVSALDGRLVAGELIPAPASAGALQPGSERLYDGVMHGAPVRIVELRSGNAVLRVAETVNKRRVLTREILLSVVLPQVLLILIAVVVIWFGVVRGLSPLERLQRSLAQRSVRDRSPVEAERVPGEVGPLLEAINGLLERLDHVLTLQSRFVSDAAHQLKTPVAALKSQFEVALRETDPQRMREALQGMQPRLERMQRLVSQLLSLARNEPDAVSAVALEPLDLDALALDVATAWVPEALRRRIDLGFEGAGAPVMVQGDAARLRELLDNLLDNAVRYSRDAGRVTVRVSAAPPTVDVNDDGPSIPPEERARVFERFHRLLGSGQDGSGLGLAIAREIAELHGGEITLREDTSDGIGNTFSLILPSGSPATDPGWRAL